MLIVMDILDRLHEFNAADWLESNSLREFYLAVDVDVFDKLKSLSQTRYNECKEIVKRKSEGQFTGDIARLVDEAFVEDVREEARELYSLGIRVENLKLAYSERQS